ncbi:MAG: hypothetical protein HYX32_04880, partial [Actinobacteria bacterium]|nr:hypothetical protein [Actinomycetota bacterium]
MIFTVLSTLAALVWIPSASAASLTSPPTRLYMAPAGTTLAAELIGVPIGEMPFTGSDIISGDNRELVVQVENGDAGCAPDQSNNWDISDCPRVQMDVSHGTIEVGSATTEFREDSNGDPDPAQPVYVLSGGAIIDQITNPPDNPSPLIHINGTKAQLDAALADLVYTPDPGYYYVGSFNPETLNIVVVSGQDSNEPPPLENPSIQAYGVEIRVLDVNDFPTIDGPSGPIQAAPEIEEIITGFTASDEDNDEDVYGAQADPPLPPPDPIDGEGTNMLLVGVLECGQPVTPLVEGFHFQGGVFQADDTSIEDIVNDTYDISNKPEYQPVVDAILAGLDQIEPGLSTKPLATSSPFDYTTAFAGVSTMAEVQYALAEITFKNDAPNDSCELTTVVSDLGNNGLPLQYIGDPPTGVEVPFLGFDFQQLTIETGDLEEIDASFAGPVSAPEGTTAEATINITPAIHPAFDLILAANDGPAIGGAIGGSDFAATSNATVSVAENQTSVTFDTNAYNDTDAEGPETFTFSLEPPVDAPPGWKVVSAVPTATVTIVDDDDPARTITSVSNPAVIEGDAGTTQMTFTLTLDGPADGNETVELDTADGSATTIDADYDALTNMVVAFAPGAASATANVTVNGDTNIEPDEQFALQLNNATLVMIGDASATGTITNDDVAPDPSPTVTIDQAAGQPDPASAPIEFTVVFSEAVTGFTATDVSLAGSTAPGTLTAAVSGSGAVYTVTVSGMTGAGDVVASIVAGAAVDSASQTSAASTSTDNVVSFAPLPDPSPTVTIDQAAGQPDPASAPIEFTVVFSEAVTGFTATDVSLAGSTAPGTLTVAVSGSGAVYTVTVSGMTGAGDVAASIVAGAAIDSASQASAASTSTDNVVSFAPLPDPSPTATIDQAAG